MKLFLKILLVLFVIGAFFRWMGHQELNTLIEEGVLDSDYTQLELAMLCEKLDVEVIFLAVFQAVFGNKKYT